MKQEQTEKLVERPTEKLGVILTQVRVPGAARDFSPESVSSVDSLTVSVQPPVCNRMHVCAR